MSQTVLTIVVATCAESPGLLKALGRVREQLDLLKQPGELLVVINDSREAVDGARLQAVEALSDTLIFEAIPGKSHALNRAVHAARGGIVAFIDDDALPEPGWLAALIAPMLADPEVAGVGGRVIPVLPAQGVPRWYRYLVQGRQGYFLGPVHDLGEGDKEYSAENMGELPLGTNSAFRRALLAEIGYAPELGPNRVEGTRGGEDLLMARRILDRGLRVVYQPDALVMHPVALNRLTPRYVLEGYYWQGVEKVRLRRALGHQTGGSWPWKVRARYAKYLPLELFVGVLPESLAVLLLRRREFHRGILDEIHGRARAARPTLAAASLAAPAASASAVVVVVLLAFALAAFLMVACGPGRTSYDKPPNVLLFVIDTLRADHLSCYGHKRATTPNIDAFAAEGLRFEEVWAPAPRTVASHASLFTSTTPAAHGVWNEPAVKTEPKQYSALSPKATCLAEVFAAAGYKTLGVADGGWLQVDRGLGQGFSLWDSVYEGVDKRVERALERLAERDRRVPFFMFLHTYEVHTPWLPSDEALEPFDNGYQGVVRKALADARAAVTARPDAALLRGVHEQFFVPLEPELGPEDVEFMRILYDAEIATTDRAFARLLEGMRALDAFDNTLIVITSDHGQEFGEHGKFDHVQVYDENLRIPLIVRLPDGHRQYARGVRSEPVALIDVMPTLLTEVGLPVPAAVSGRALDLHVPPEQPELRELWGEMGESHPQVMLIEGPRRAIFPKGDQGAVDLFDGAAVPGAAQDLSADFAEQARQRLAAYRAESAARALRFSLAPVPRSRDIFEDEQQRLDELRALGYL